MAEFVFVMDDPEAVQILAAYFPARDNVAGPDRLRWAIEVRRKLHPSEDHAQAEQEVRNLLAIEEAEHSLLTAYWGVVILNMQALRRATRYIQENCRDVFTTAQSQELWHNIVLALSSCAAISRMFESSTIKAPKDSVERVFRDRRAALLKSATGLTGTSTPYLEQIKIARNAIEHFEEYLDVWLDKAMLENKKIWDLQCVTEAEVKASDAYFARWFDNNNNTVHVFDLAISIADLDQILSNLEFVNISIMMRGRYHPEWSFGLYG